MMGRTSGKQANNVSLKGACLLSALFYLALGSAQAENGSKRSSTPPAVQKASAVRGVAKSTAKKLPASESREAVDLLESIFERLRSVPQLAVTRSKQTLAYRVYGNNGNMLQGTVDPLLIKPKDLSRLSSRLKKLSDNAVAAAAPSGSTYTNASAGRSVPMITNESGIWERAQMPQLASEPQQVRDSFVADKKAYAQDRVKSYAGAKSPLIADGADSDTTLIASQPLIREFGATASKAEAPLNAPQSPGIAGQPMAAGQEGSNYLRGATNGTIGAQGARVAIAPNLYRKDQVQSESLKNLEQTLSGKNLAKNLPRANAEARQVQKALNEAQLLRPDLAKTGALASSDDLLSISNAQQVLDARQPKMGLDVALLPVTKFMGIPQIRLGTSEAEALAVAIQIGTVRRETIKGWSVWSITKGKGKQPSLQFFLRAGNLDAIRVLDPIFWDTKHGLTVGTGLPDVKRQLGEPAFIISNDTSPSAQNYVYPISQVDFQLKRSADDDVPKIVSILLFAVK